MGNAMAAYLFKNMFEVNSCLNSFKHDINCLNTIKTSDFSSTDFWFLLSDINDLTMCS